MSIGAKYYPEIYLAPCQLTMSFSGEKKIWALLINSERLLPNHYFRKKLHCRCLIGSPTPLSLNLNVLLPQFMRRQNNTRRSTKNQVKCSQTHRQYTKLSNVFSNMHQRTIFENYSMVFISLSLHFSECWFGILIKPTRILTLQGQ